jgi:hypothetical protein
MMARWRRVRGTLLVLAGVSLLAGSPARADEPGPRSSAGHGVALRGCGGDAFSFAEVAPPRHSRGPVYTIPDTLCADVEERRPPAIGSLNVVIEPPGRRGAPGPEAERGSWPWNPSR